jgi:lysyl-tRNA synthetase class 2
VDPLRASSTVRISVVIRRWLGYIGWVGLNAKYRPLWEPRFLLFAKSSDIPRIGLAGARAEGFLTPAPLPALRRRRRSSMSEAEPAPATSSL